MSLGTLHTSTLVIILLAAAVLMVAAILTVIRLSRGPSSLDRIIASDVMVGIVIAGLAIEATVNDHDTTFPVMVVLSLIGFAGAVGMARFVGDRDVGTGSREASTDVEERGERG